MIERQRTWKRAPRTTQVLLPKGATDSHCHVFGPVAQFAFMPSDKPSPADAPKEALFALHDQMGIERCVIVQSGYQGFDNAVIVDAMQARPGRYLGIALAAPDVSNAALDTLAAKGFRGVRLNYMAHLAPGANDSELHARAPRLAIAACIFWCIWRLG